MTQNSVSSTLLASEGGGGMHSVAASGVFSATWLVIALPLLGAAVLLLCGKRGNRLGHWLGTLLALGSFAVGVALFAAMLGKDGAERSIDQHLWNWVPAADFQAEVGLHLDQLSMVFVLLITGVGSLIHIYSIGYMAEDPDRRRFFAYLNLFLASMLLLVLANNYLLLYVGWEGVGLASYLLIGFWQHKPSAATAAKKAFIMNRVGDFGLAVAIFLMFTTFGTFAFDDVLGGSAEASDGTMTAIGLMLLLAACGKSAQFPLQAWLGDAMEGPTPVSALIHAATMVTAGVYLITRSAEIFNASPDAQLVVTIVGAVTVLFGAIVGCAKDDIKKALAASTMSQIGYMILAAGLGPIGYAFAIMHLVTHGFFKAGLFLGAGSVMHGMNDEVDMRRYGGLRKYMPVTFVTFGLGYLAIIGFPLLSGFFSKDKIIEAAFAKGGTSGYILGSVTLVAAALTAYYMTRVMLMTFFGRERWKEAPVGAPAEWHEPHPHESPASMTVPMIVLAFGSVFAGGLFVLNDAFVNWLTPVTGFDHGELPFSVWVVTGMATAMVALGVLVAYVQYARREVPAVAPHGSLVTVAARKDLYQDSINEGLVMRPGQYLTRLLVWLDGKGIDGFVGGLAAFIGGTSARVRKVQTGFARSYALSMFGGTAVVVAATLMARMA